MASKKDKGTIFIVISSVVFLPNIGCLVIALTDLYPPPILLLIVPGVMILAAILGLIYGISLHRRS